MFPFLSSCSLKYLKLLSLQLAYQKGQSGKIVWFWGLCQDFSQILLWLGKQKWRIQSLISVISLKPVLEYSGSLNLLSLLLLYWLSGKKYRSKLDSGYNWTQCKTVVSSSFICSTAIKLWWLLGLNHSLCYLFPSICTHSCLVIFIHCTKGEKGEHSCDAVSCLHW